MYSALYGNDALKRDRKWLADVFLFTMCIKILHLQILWKETESKVKRYCEWRIFIMKATGIVRRIDY